jgi:HxlR-like helix-turn-helix
VPGIATNVLGDCLQLLQQAWLVRRATLLPPAASAVYELTGRGRQLKPVLLALAGWGLPPGALPGLGQRPAGRRAGVGPRPSGEPRPEALQQLRRLFPNRLPQKSNLRARFRGPTGLVGWAAGGPRVSPAFEVGHAGRGGRVARLMTAEREAMELARPIAEGLAPGTPDRSPWALDLPRFQDRGKPMRASVPGSCHLREGGGSE